ncbi:MAG: helix-turn-helix domain-containing protein [Candidatus Methanomethyliaceae archaeon]|nr:helix-turn-helix domain-containing protein [Candidatus Methanomethyliaceae archaeon]
MSLEKIEHELSAIKERLDEIIILQREILARLEGREPLKEGLEIDASLLLRLPDHLRKTMMALAKLVRARAEDIAKITGRARAVESGYLNQLVRMGYVRKEREGHEVYFSIG